MESYHSLTLHSRYFSSIRIAMILVFFCDYLVAFILEDINMHSIFFYYFTNLLQDIGTYLD